MDIDLLFTANGEAGLISDNNLVQKAAGAVFSMNTGIMTLELVDMDYIDLNIPVDSQFFETLDRCYLIHFGAYTSGHIAQAYQMPLMILEDPYRNQFIPPVVTPENPLSAFDYYMRRCVTGQPVNRQDLGDETKMGCILGDSVPASLQFAPHLARRLGFEVAPKLAPGPNVPGLGLGSSGGGSGYIQPQQQNNNKGKKGSDDR